MPSNITASLETINELSRLILLQLNIRIENAAHENSQQGLPDVSSETTGESTYTDEQLSKLVTERHNRIDLLFKTYPQVQLSGELPLINEMVSLDQDLTSKSQSNKQLLASQIIRLKNSKKVTNLYKKY